MDSFVSEGVTNRMKRKYQFDNSLSELDTQDLFSANTRHNLMEDFGETPLKSSRVSHVGSRSFLNTTPTQELNLLKKENNLKDAEIIALRSNITNLENQIAKLSDAARQAKIEFDSEMTKMKTEKERDRTKLTEMRSKVQFVMEREKNTKEEMNRLQVDKDKQILELKTKLVEVQNDKILASDLAQQNTAKLLKEKEDIWNTFYQMMSEKSSLQSKLNEAEAQLALRKTAQAQNEELRKELEEIKQALAEEQQKNKVLENEFSEQEDNIMITKARKSDLDLVPKMKIELEKLRQDNEQLRQNEQNTLLLEEEVRSLKSKLEYAHTMQEKLAALEVENEELQGRLQRWEATDSSGSRRPMSPSSLSRRILESETLQASLVLANGELQSEHTLTLRKLNQAEGEIKRLTLELSAKEQMIALQLEKEKRAWRKDLLLTKERDSYKSLLDSYESEVTVNFDSQRKCQVLKLEEVIAGYKEQNSSLESEIRSLSEKLMTAQIKYEQVKQNFDGVQQSEQQKSSRESEDLIKQLQERIAVLENTLLKTQEERDILEARIEQRDLQGDYDPSKIKIIHFSMNPFAKAQKAHQDELQKLREDNETLKKRNQILEEKGHVADITLQVQEKLKQPSPSKEVEEIKAQLKREETRNKRLMEVFKKTSQEFREICYQLTGYKIDIPCTNQYRLTSMYAESPHDYLLFQQNEKGEILMLQTDFSLTLQEPMEMYLQNQNSIPMFLSHITMDLFGKQTMNLG
ncbi:mitotic spindle assembly checkpoint protein MAD1 [Biomphalaria glabrata]|nr:mitotic spindle assembly checkpoint protein MAD1-like [Biomphalaria glabrata]KAI8794883.1 mitotic spindle assembly checkpoint protein MAD1 [Biomphalaria glabrata]